MTVENGAAQTGIKIRPGRRMWILYFLCGGCFLASAAIAVAGGRVWFTLFYLATAFGNIALGLMIRTAGVDLTPDFAIVRTLRPRRIRWGDVQEVVSYKKSNGTSVVQLILAEGEPVTLRHPTTQWRNGDTNYEQDLQRIEQWWHAHRGESWHPVHPAAPQPPDLR